VPPRSTNQPTKQPTNNATPKKQSYFNDMFAAAPKPTPSDAFPVRGCTIGVVPGFGFVPAFSRFWFENTSNGWSGKCFYDPPRGSVIPDRLINMLGLTFQNASLPMAERVRANLTAPAVRFFLSQALRLLAVHVCFVFAFCVGARAHISNASPHRRPPPPFACPNTNP
jgi:hypothetical protein